MLGTPLGAENKTSHFFLNSHRIGWSEDRFVHGFLPVVFRGTEGKCRSGDLGSLSGREGHGMLPPLVRSLAESSSIVRGEENRKKLFERRGGRTWTLRRQGRTKALEPSAAAWAEREVVQEGSEPEKKFRGNSVFGLKLDLRIDGASIQKKEGSVACA